MSALRTSRPPVPAMSGDAEATPAKPATAIAEKPAKKAASKKPLSAAKASKATPVAKVVDSPAARTNAKGEKLRCQVGRGAKQCSNPGRWPHGKGWTCSTHDRAIRGGKHLEIAGSATAVYAAPKPPAKPASEAAVTTE